MKKYSNFYQDAPYSLNGYYYIHLHSKNIGLLRGGDTNDIYTAFQGFKENQIKNGLKNEFKRLFKSQITADTDEKVWDMVSLITDPERGDKILTDINDAVKDALQKSVDTNHISKVLDTVKNKKLTSWEEGTEDWLRSLCQQINDILTIVTKSMDIYRKDGKTTLLALEYDKINDKKVEGIGEALKKVLASFEQQLKSDAFRLNQQQINSVIGALNSLVNMLETGKTSKGKNITSNSIAHHFSQNIFSTGIGEIAGFDIDTIANGTVFNEISESSLKMQGKTGVQLEISAPSGEHKKYTGQELSGKVDVQLSHVGMEIVNEMGESQGTLRLSIGISNKLYQGVAFRYGKEDSMGEFSVGGGLTLEQALQQCFKNNKLMYLAYNMYGWYNQIDSQAFINLQDIVFTRSIIKLFMSRGGSLDVAGYLLLNGKIISVWEIITYALEHNIGISHSQQRELKMTDKTAISFGFTNQDTYSALTAFQQHINQDKWDADKRAESVGQAIAKAGLHGYIRPGLLLKAIPNNANIT